MADVEHNTVTNLSSAGTDRIAVFFENDAPFVSALVKDNSLAVGNDRYGAVNASPSGTLDATCNWWGDAAGPNSISGSDTFGPITSSPPGGRRAISRGLHSQLGRAVPPRPLMTLTGNEGTRFLTAAHSAVRFASITSDAA